MLRLSGLKLPLDHPADAMPAAICERLGIEASDLVRHVIVRRGNDARRKTAIQLVYTVDVELMDEAAVLERLAGDHDVRRRPDTDYRFVTHAPQGWSGKRPVVVGAGPCGLFAGLILAQMGFRPIILDRGKVVRERTKDTWGLWRRAELNPDSNVQFGEGGAGTFINKGTNGRWRGHLFGWQAVLPCEGSAFPGPQGAGGICRGGRA